ncbi:unnamed protein product [Musa hybrid cultivar]
MKASSRTLSQREMRVRDGYSQLYVVYNTSIRSFIIVAMLMMMIELWYVTLSHLNAAVHRVPGERNWNRCLRGGGEEDQGMAADEGAKGWSGRRWRCGGEACPRKGGDVGGVTLQGYVVDTASGGERWPGGIAGTRSLTEEDLEELKGCLDLGFGFNYEGIPELRNTLPALELCYSMSQMFHLNDQRQPMPPEDSPPIANWKISSPGRDDPDEVKARLKYWAQAVACTLRLCS